jgi:hypothetical protein
MNNDVFNIKWKPGDLVRVGYEPETKDSLSSPSLLSGSMSSGLEGFLVWKEVLVGAALPASPVSSSLGAVDDASLPNYYQRIEALRIFEPSKIGMLLGRWKKRPGLVWYEVLIENQIYIIHIGQISDIVDDNNSI